MAPKQTVSANERWDAVVRRDTTAAESFVYAVTTTGVFCRPSCASRQPRRANVEFFERSEDAVKAGFRPCKRCRPDAADPGQEGAALIVSACRLLEQHATTRTEDVAREVGLSPFYFSRLFKRRVGVTPQEYRRRVVAERAKGGIARAPSVTAAIYDAGYTSSSRFYEGVGQELGMAPRAARRGAIGQRVAYAIRCCSLGRLLIAWTERGVCDVRFGDGEAERALAEALRERFPGATLERSGVPELVEQVVAAVERPGGQAIPLDIYGTAFQQRVWRELRRIPRGETRSYAQIADAVGSPRGARAVAQACAANSLAVLVPCHRVVRGDGELAGYRWGAERKEELLRRERGGK